MKIIKAQYEPLMAESSSIYLRNLLSWLLQKVPEHRPSMRDLLSEVSNSVHVLFVCK